MQKTINRKWPNVSIIGIKDKLSISNWNSFLTKCYRENDVLSLKKILYGIQADMSDLQKTGVADSEIVNLFLRLQTSIEKTARRLFRKIYPSPLDDPRNNARTNKRLLIKNGSDTTSIERAKADFYKSEVAKKKRDHEFEKFLTDSRF